MEFGRVSGDHYAGYVVEDSDLEYSDCTDSSEDERCDVNGFPIKAAGHTSHGHRLSSEDEFEKEMDSEALATLKLMVSPTAAAEAVRGHVTRTTSTSSGGGGRDDTVVVTRDGKKKARASGRVSRRRRGSTEQGKTVRFALESKTEDELSGGGRTASGGQELSEPDGMDSGPSSSAPEEYYDDIYFDSSGSEEEGGGADGIKKVGKKVRKMTDDELFYDPKMDEEDEKWMKRQRMNYLNVKTTNQARKPTLAQQIDSLSALSTSTSSSLSAPPTSLCSSPPSTSPSTSQVLTDENITLPKSDAVLNCPACMTTLCLDCQRHDVYVNQYRAMFVVNCCILREEVLKYFPKPDKKSRKRKNRGKQKGQATAGASNAATGGEEGMVEGEADKVAEHYHPVRCTQCNTEVAVYDKDEVFHFFNVLASTPG